MPLFINLLKVALICSLAHAQFPPPLTSVTFLDSNDKSGASLSYKQTYICETTPGVNSYSGYVNLPSTLTGESFNISTFYWYFSARKNPSTAPLTIYLAGGAGETSLDGVNGEGGPCTINADSNSTTLNPWSWNNEVNVLYIDQPVQTGFSYDRLVNGTLDLLTGNVTPLNDTSEVVQNETTVLGTFPSQDPAATTQGSVSGASALWHFMQVFVGNFPCEKVKDKRISIWGNSWAGFFMPPFFALIIRQNEAIAAKEISGHILPLDTLGSTNGCIDPLIEAPQYPQMAVNNTYGFKAYNETVLEFVLSELDKVGGCKDLVGQCRELAQTADPNFDGNNQTVNELCGVEAFGVCFGNVQGPYLSSERSAFDISHPAQDPFPNYRPSGYYNQAWVQSALGVPVNITEENYVVQDVYAEIGDAIRGNISNIEFILEKGYQVVMVHGDRDYRCNWLGGEAVSLAAQWNHTVDFNEAGYANIQTNATYDGGYVRQAGKFSFSRVFQAGHAVMAFQPETVFRIFQRAMSGLDVATGRKRIDKEDCDVYKTVGPNTVRNATVLPAGPEIECYTWAANSTCTLEQTAALANGTALVKDYVVIEPGPES